MHPLKHLIDIASDVDLYPQAGHDIDSALYGCQNTPYPRLLLTEK